MTKSQKMVIDYIEAHAVEQLGYGEDYELKQFEVEEMKYFVSLYVVVGKKNDEGTMLSILGRQKIHIFIYKKGGIKYYSKKQKQKTGSRFNLFTIYYNQQY